MAAIRALLILFLMVASVAWARQPVYTVGVDGLACPFCTYGIEKQLHKLDGVEQVDTDIEQGRVVIKMSEGKTLDESRAERVVKKAGFSLRSFERVDESAAP